MGGILACLPRSNKLRLQTPAPQALENKKPDLSNDPALKTEAFDFSYVTLSLLYTELLVKRSLTLSFPKD
jgi:hypothetical protein